MPAKETVNLLMLANVATGLKHLKEDVVFVGGATIDLYLSDATATAARPTDDVDCVVNIIHRSTYHNLEEDLRKLNFEHDMSEGAPICRWIYNGIKVDVMPTEGKVLDFNNRWYPDGVANAESTELHDGQSIAIFSIPFLLASKIEAFHDRGKKDFIGSPDIEDILTVIDGHVDVKEKILQAPETVRAYIKEQFKKFLADQNFLDAVAGHLPATGRATRAITILKEVAEAP